MSDKTGLKTQQKANASTDNSEEDAKTWLSIPMKADMGRDGGPQQKTEHEY